ncbi:MAG: zf-TFIIB domain-containing protein [Elusimicrobia bacterium]|nr:zf-TFIIB domain-containing protein [Elusimicrobiota bacterium]
MPACPACVSSALTELADKSGVAFDCCGKCRGVWLDGGELSQLLGKPFPEALLSAKDGERKCPRCSKPMQRGGFINPALVVDRCAYCSGLWLDAAELRVVRKILGVIHETDAEKAAPAAAPLEPPKPQPKWESPPAPAPAPGPYLGALPTTGGQPFADGSWKYHGGWWLIAGLGAAFYGWKRHSEWKAITDAGVTFGKDPGWIALAGAVMLLVGLGFLIVQPADSTEFYTTLFKSLLSSRSHRYHRRCRHSWYDDTPLI